MNDELLLEFTDHGGEHKVEIYERDDGSYTFEEWKFVVEEIPSGEIIRYWSPINRDSSIPICSSLEIVMREATGRIPWLKEVLPED